MLKRYSEILYNPEFFKVDDDYYWLFNFLNSEYVYNAAQGIWFKTSYGELYSFEDVFIDIMDDVKISNHKKEDVLFNLIDLKMLPSER